MALDFQFSCPLPHGLHARPASQIASLANGFSSSCALTNSRNKATANLKSVLSIIAADVRLDDPCSIRVEGADETVAGAALQRFVSHELPHCDAPLPGPQSRQEAYLPRALRTPGAEMYTAVSATRGGL